MSRRDRLLTVAEAAALTSQPAATVRRWIFEGLLPVEHVGPTRRVRVRWSTLERFYPADVLRAQAAGTAERGQTP